MRRSLKSNRNRIVAGLKIEVIQTVIDSFLIKGGMENLINLIDAFLSLIKSHSIPCIVLLGRASGS